MSGHGPSFSAFSHMSHILGEGPRWFEGKLWWIDIDAGELWSSDGREPPGCILKIPRQIGGFAITTDERIVLATRAGFELFDPSTGQLSPLANPQPTADTRFNDGRVDAAGRFWAGTMAVDPARYGEPLGVLYRLDGDGRVTQHLDRLTISNGIDWSNDSRTMYLNDTMRGTTWAFDYDLNNGTLANRRVFASISPDDGWPDGLVVDAQDHVWIAVIGGGRLLRFRPDGDLDCTIPVGTTWPTALAFGGGDLSTLFVTTSRHLMPVGHDDPLAGGVLKASGNWKGRPEHHMQLHSPT